MNRNKINQNIHRLIHLYSFFLNFHSNINSHQHWTNGNLTHMLLYSNINLNKMATSQIIRSQREKISDSK